MHLATATTTHVYPHTTSLQLPFSPGRQKPTLDVGRWTEPLEGARWSRGECLPGRDAQAPVYPWNLEDLLQPHPEEGVEGG